MKKLLAMLALASLVFVSPICARADILGNVSLALFYSSPTGVVTFPGGSAGNYYLDYDVILNNGSPSEAFCVENMAAPSSTGTPYTLLSIDSSLTDFGLDPLKYLKAAAIADYFYTNPPSSDALKAAAQIAVWETVFDPTFDLKDGSFRADNQYSAEAQNIWNAISGSIPTSDLNWANANWDLAVNPIISASNTTVKVAGSQNYLVRASVPEPLSLLLLGVGLLGIAGLRRRVK